MYHIFLGCGNEYEMRVSVTVEFHNVEGIVWVSECSSNSFCIVVIQSEGGLMFT